MGITKVLMIITFFAVAMAIALPLFISSHHSRHVDMDMYNELVISKLALEDDLTTLNEEASKQRITIASMKRHLTLTGTAVDDFWVGVGSTVDKFRALHQDIIDKQTEIYNIEQKIKEAQQEIETIEETMRQLKASLPSYGGGGGWAPCFACDTLVLMADNSIKHISVVQVGEMVKAYDVESGTVVVKAVAATNSGEADYYYLINGNLKVTPPHPFYTAQGKWVKVTDLKVGDKVRSLEGLTQITSIEKVNSGQRICNISVQDFHNFFVSVNGEDFYLVQE